MKKNFEEIVSSAKEKGTELVEKTTEELKVVKGNLDKEQDTADIATGLMYGSTVGFTVGGVLLIAGAAIPVLPVAIFAGAAVALGTAVAPEVKYSLWKWGILRKGYSPVRYLIEDAAKVVKKEQK